LIKLQEPTREFQIKTVKITLIDYNESMRESALSVLSIMKIK
jgi:hypothetical protein